MPSVFIHVPSPFLFKLSAASERGDGEGERGEGRRRMRRTRRVREEEECFLLENEASRSRLFSRRRSCHRSVQNILSHKSAKKPPKPVIRFHFEHQGNSSTSRSGSFQLHQITDCVYKDGQLPERKAQIISITRLCWEALWVKNLFFSMISGRTRAKLRQAHMPNTLHSKRGFFTWSHVQVLNFGISWV